MIVKKNKEKTKEKFLRDSVSEIEVIRVHAKIKDTTKHKKF